MTFPSVQAGGQDLFIGPNGKGNSNLTNQTAMHAENEFKHIDTFLREVKRSAVAAAELSY